MKEIDNKGGSMEYIKEDVERMLREHKDNESKLTEIELKLDECNKRLEYAGTVYEDNEKDVIEGMQLSGQVLSDMPKGGTNKISDITYDTVANYNKEIIHINKEDRGELERKILKLKNEKDILNKVIVRTKNIIEPLTKEEKFVIEMYYINNSKWDYVEETYCREFDKHKTPKQLQSYRNSAILRMLKILNAGE